MRGLTAGFIVNGRTALVDRSDLRAEITVEHVGDAATDENAALLVRLYNTGCRPVRVEEVGFWSDKSRLTRFPSWDSWEYWMTRVELPKPFGETTRSPYLGVADVHRRLVRQASPGSLAVGQARPRRTALGSATAGPPRAERYPPVSFAPGNFTNPGATDPAADRRTPTGIVPK